jgi:phytanoyl-CoA hydroxylase
MGITTRFEEIRIQYETQGFVYLPGVIPPAFVERLRRAFDDAAARYEPQWREAVAAGRADPRFFDIPDILDQDDVFVDLVDLPSIFPILIETVGPDIQLNHTHARCFYPGKTFVQPWHSDVAEILGIDLAHTLNFIVKVHYYFEDLAPNQGCLAFIPGSHRRPAGAPAPKIEDPDHSSAVVKVVPKAGDAVLFNTHVLHMCQDNESGRVRKSIIYAYSHYWVKHYANAVPANLEKYLTAPHRYQLFGVDIPGVPYINRRLDREVEEPWHSSLRQASARILKRSLLGDSKAGHRRRTGWKIFRK